MFIISTRPRISNSKFQIFFFFQKKKGHTVHWHALYMLGHDTYVAKDDTWNLQIEFIIRHNIYALKEMCVSYFLYFIALNVLDICVITPFFGIE